MSIFNNSDWMKSTAITPVDVQYLDKYFVTQSELLNDSTHNQNLGISSVTFIDNPGSVQFRDATIQTTGFTDSLKTAYDTVVTKINSNVLAERNLVNTFSENMTLAKNLFINSSDQSNFLTVQANSTNTILSNSKKNTNMIFSTVDDNNASKQLIYSAEGDLIVPRYLKFGSAVANQAESFTQAFRDAITLSTNKLSLVTRGLSNQFVVSATIEANAIESINDIKLLNSASKIIFGDGTFLQSAPTNIEALPITMSTDSVTNKKIYTFEEGSSLVANSGVLKTRQVEITSAIKFNDGLLQGKAYTDTKDQMNSFKTWIRYDSQHTLSGGSGTGTFNTILPVAKSVQLSDTTPSLIKDCMYIFTLRIRVYAINRLTSLNFDYIRLYSHITGGTNPPNNTSDARYQMSSNFNITTSSSTFVYNSATSHQEWEKTFFFRANQTTSNDIGLSINAIYNITTINSSTNLIFSFMGNLVQL